MLKIAWNKYYCHPLPENHRFPMIKYDLIPEQLLYEGTINDSNIFSPTLLNEATILLTHTNEYWQKLKFGKLDKAEVRKIGFPYSPELVKREQIITKGTIDCALFALEYGVSLNVAGGTHHAYSNKGGGFCLLNDTALAANFLLTQKLINKVLVIDLDVHQGDGTAEIFKNESRVFTFSMHGEKNYPMNKENSDLDIPLKDYTNDQTYLKLLDHHLKKLIDMFEP